MIKEILSRRSCRSYKPDRISREDIDQLLECAIHAPSARNTQPFYFYAIDDKSVIDGLAAGTKKAMIAAGIASQYAYAESYHYLFNAPLAVIVGSDFEDLPYYKFDCSFAGMNMIYAAQELGISSCILCQPNVFFETGEGRQFLFKHGIKCPEVQYTIVFGYQKGPTLPATARRRDKIFYITDQTTEKSE